MNLERKNIQSVLPFIAVVVMWNSPFLLKGIIIERNILLELILLEVFVFGAIASLALIWDRMERVYVFSFFTSATLLLIFLSGGYLRFAPIFAVASIVSLRYFRNRRTKDDFLTGSLSYAIFLLLLLLSTSMRFIHASATSSLYPGYAFSIYNNASAAGIPFTYAFGIVISFGQVTLTISPITAVLFPLIAYLTADNTILIVRAFRSKSAYTASGALVAALACQCENTIGILSGTVSSLALSLLPYFIFVSAALLILTNIYLHNPIRLKIPDVKLWIIVILFLLMLSIEFSIVLTGMVYNLAYFGFISFLSIISGFLLGFIVPIKRRLPSYSVAVAFLIQGIMFWPELIKASLSVPFMFEIYSLAAISAGLLLSLSFKNRRMMTKVGLFELIFSMETMITAAFLYLALFSVSLFSGFSVAEVIDFSVLILLVSIPAMWVSNIYLLSLRSFGV